MTSYQEYIQSVSERGFAIVEQVFSKEETDAIISVIDQVDASSQNFKKSSELFAVRQFLKEVPNAAPHIFSERLNDLIHGLFGKGYFVVKSIYFDKPEASNWFVAYHQDLTISVDRKVEVAGFGSWTVKQNQFAVQPPMEVLERNFTIRIHLDDTDADNGALKVIPGSHLQGIIRPGDIHLSKSEEVVCAVPKGGVMIMKPLLLHASGRTTNQHRRRVIHIEFSDTRLPAPLRWSEKS